MNVELGSGPLLAFSEPFGSSGDAGGRAQPLTLTVGDSEIEYFRAREEAEWAAAKSAASVTARRVHEELAQIYAMLVRQRTGEP